MISTETTRFIGTRVEQWRAAEAAAQATLDEQIRLDDARQSWTVQELLDLINVALEDGLGGDRLLVSELAWDVVHRDSRYVRTEGWNFHTPVRLRPDDVPAEVYVITGDTCDGGSCSYCTCCELWNGEHSCEWWATRRPQTEEDEWVRLRRPWCRY